MRTGMRGGSSCLSRAMKIVEARDHFLDSWLFEPEVRKFVLRGDLLDELRDRDHARIERQLERISVARADFHSWYCERRDLADKIDEQAPVLQHMSPQRIERCVRQDDAVADDYYALRQPFDIVHVVRSENDRDALIAIQPLHKFASGQLRRRVKANRRLVEE